MADTPPTSFVKADAGKSRPDLLPPRALGEVARVLAYGAAKYAPGNWIKAPTWSRYSAAALRHLLAWLGGEDRDPESGLPHLAHACCSLLFLLELGALGLSVDDRLQPPQPAAPGDNDG